MKAALSVQNWQTFFLARLSGGLPPFLSEYSLFSAIYRILLFLF
jgi:hypothetical protein